MPWDAGTIGWGIINGHEALASAHREWTEEVLNFEGLRRKEMWMRRSPMGPILPLKTGL